MTAVVETENESQWLCIPTLDNNVHVMPVGVIQGLISGEIALSAVDDSELLMRSILREWLDHVMADSSMIEDGLGDTE